MNKKLQEAEEAYNAGKYIKARTLAQEIVNENHGKWVPCFEEPGRLTRFEESEVTKKAKALLDKIESEISD